MIRNNNKRLIVCSTSILAGTLMISSCSISLKKDINQSTDLSDQYNTNTLGTYGSDNEPSKTESSSSLNIPKNANYLWDNNKTKDFSNYVNKKLGIELAGYVKCYGFTNDLNKVYTQYINENYSTDYDMVPFSASNYFYTYLVSDAEMKRYRKYEIFCARFLNNEKCTKGTFNNKLIISYMIQNSIPFGTRIDVNNFKNIDQNFINIGKEYNLEYYSNHYKLGNYDKSYKYSSGELIGILKHYNNSLCYIYYSEGIKDQDLLKNQELCDIFNEHLKQFYGDNAIQIGKVPTKEQYIAIFGEEPLDLSYIPGAVMQVPQETMASPVSYIDYNNYNVYYNPNYNMYSEEDTGRSR